MVQFRGALRMASDDWRAHYSLGVALEATGDETGAVSEYREASKLFPETPDVHRDLVKLLEKRLDYPAVLEQYTRMIHLHLASYSDLAAARGLILLNVKRGSARLWLQPERAHYGMHPVPLREPCRRHPVREV